MQFFLRELGHLPSVLGYGIDWGKRKVVVIYDTDFTLLGEPLKVRVIVIGDCNGFLVQHHSAGLSQTKNILNSVSRDDLTTTKLASENNANTADPTRNKTQRSGKCSKVYYPRRWRIVTRHSVIIQRQFGLEMLLGLVFKKEWLNICDQAYL